MRNGIRASSSPTAFANSEVQRGDSAKISSANQMLSGCRVCFRCSISAATARALREMIILAVNRFRAPVTSVRTPAARCHVEREVAVRSDPGGSVTLGVDQVPCRKRKAIKVVIHFPSRGSDDTEGAFESKAPNLFRRPPLRQFEQRGLDFTEGNKRKTRAQKLLDVVGCIGAV